MDQCNCKIYDDIADRPSLEKRFKYTKKIISGLTLIADHPNGEHKLYHCKNCGQYWQFSMSWMDGNKKYIFQVPEISVDIWKEKPFVQPDDLLVRSGHIVMYLEGVTFIEQDSKCRREGCDNNAIKMSVLCALHHLNSINIKVTLPDNETWFAPYEKSKYELTIDFLKSLPNYKSLGQ